MNMMRKLYLILSFFVLALCVNAQTKNDFKSEWVVGVGGGATFNRFFFTPSVSQHTLNGYLGGIMLRYDVESYASLQMEINYSKSGWKERFDNTGTIDKSYQRELQYIRIPILTNIHYDIKMFSIFLNAGPEFGYQIKENSVETGSNDMTEWEKMRHDMPSSKKFSWGLTGGLGIAVAFDRHRVELEGRYTYGFGDIWSTNRVDPYGKASESIIGVRLNYLITVN